MVGNYSTFRQARSLVDDLRDVQHAAAPTSLLPSVLTRVGIADAYVSVETPLGPVFVSFNNRGISAVLLAPDATSFESAFRARFGRSVYPVAEPPAQIRRAIDDVLQGRARDAEFDLRGLSEFERAVLRKALEIPRGEVRPYAWIAREIGRPRAVRAVGTALKRNPIPWLIPCHRVVRSDGKIGEYAFGSERKRALLASEGADPAEIESLASAGIRYVGSGTTKIYCFPTCHHARRIAPRYQRRFHSDAEAAAAGFRPCKVCRPLASEAVG